MKIRYSILLNFVFLLMFWGPLFPIIYNHIREGYLSLTDFYNIHLIAILGVSLLSFVVLSVIDITVNIWGRLNYWYRYLLLIGLWILDWIPIHISVFLIIKKYGIYEGCGGGSPLMMALLIVYYVPIGFVITLIAYGIKAAIEIYREVKPEGENKQENSV